MMFDGDEPVVIDFQIAGTGSGIYDVGYFISQSIATEVRRGHDRELVDFYLDRLEFHGITLDRDEMWRQYLVAICFCVTYGVTSFASYPEQNERGKQLVTDMLLRSLDCVADNDALKVIS
jgi:hypothetical protein